MDNPHPSIVGKRQDNGIEYYKLKHIRKSKILYFAIIPHKTARHSVQLRRLITSIKYNLGVTHADARETLIKFKRAEK